jgi:hypothetical protein
MAYTKSPFAQHARDVVVAIAEEQGLTLAQRSQLQRELERAYETLFSAAGVSPDVAHIIVNHFTDIVAVDED